jgi:hypothetical protein
MSASTAPTATGAHPARLPGRWIAVVCGSVVSVVLVLAGVFLAAAHWPAEAIIGLLSAIATTAALLCGTLAKMLDLDTKQDQQTVALAQITEQTNGALDARIAAAIEVALAKRQTGG